MEVKIGDRLYCALVDGWVTVVGFNSAGWPLCKRVPWSKPALVIYGELLRELRIGVASEVAARFGVHQRTLSKWRTRLRLPRSPAERERMRHALGRPAHPNTLAAIHRRAGSLRGKTKPPISAQTRDKMSRAAQNRKRKEAIDESGKIRLFFEAGPGVSDRSVSEKLGIPLNVVAAHRDKASRTPKIAKAVRDVFSRFGRADVVDFLEAMLGREPSEVEILWVELLRANRSIIEASKGVGWCHTRGYKLAERIFKFAGVSVPRRKRCDEWPALTT